MARKDYWTEEQAAEDFQSAADYLSFMNEPAATREIVSRLRVAPIVYHLAANILRVAGLPVLAESNVHVVRVLDEYHKGNLLTPVLIVRGTGGGRLTFALADGYFRICASVYLNELAQIPCRMVPKDPPKPPEPDPPKPTPEPEPVRLPVDVTPTRPRVPRIYG